MLLSSLCCSRQGPALFASCSLSLLILLSLGGASLEKHFSCLDLLLTCLHQGASPSLSLLLLLFLCFPFSSLTLSFRILVLCFSFSLLSRLSCLISLCLVVSLSLCLVVSFTLSLFLSLSPYLFVSSSGSVPLYLILSLSRCLMVSLSHCLIVSFFRCLIVLSIFVTLCVCLLALRPLVKVRSLFLSLHLYIWRKRFVWGGV